MVKSRKVSSRDAEAAPVRRTSLADFEANIKARKHIRKQVKKSKKDKQSSTVLKVLHRFNDSMAQSARQIPSEQDFNKELFG